jgi:acyl transferase domain-containing protein
MLASAPMPATYAELGQHLEKLDGRDPARYRFDLEADIEWARLSEPGDFAGPSLLRALGVDAAALEREPEARALFQWAWALNVCEEFILLEDTIVRFLAQEGDQLGDSKSAAWLGEEEEKHIAVFRRYAAHLRANPPLPEAVSAFDASFERDRVELATTLDPAEYPSARAYHFAFWLKVLFFEEYTLFLDERLKEDAELVQPAWRSAHSAHRREEEQHAPTDAAYLRALTLTDEERLTWSKLFVVHLESSLGAFLALDTPRRLVAARFPDLELAAPSGEGVTSALRESPIFRRTRAAAPALSPRGDARRRVSVPGRDKTLVRVREIWADVLGVPVEEVDVDATFAAMGGDSVTAVEIHGQLEDRYARDVDFEILRTCTTVREFATYLKRHVGPLPAGARAEPPAAPKPRAAPDAASSDDIAVVAMAGRFPGAPTLDDLWDLLRDGRSAFGRVPASRWDADAYYDPDPSAPGKAACDVGAFLDDVERFDPEAFGLDEAHARDMEPQQRLFLELAGDLLDRAGLVTDDVGVFAATGWNTYLPRYRPEAITGLTAVGNLHNMVAARVSQVLGLKGPAFTVDAACASSLVAVHLACRAVRDGECDAAIAGGVELVFNPQSMLSFARARVLSTSGACLPFDQRASGFLLGEGGGAVLLRRLSDARAAGDDVVAVIRGSALNNDGGGYSWMSPSPEGQMDVLRKAYARAGVSPADVSFIEAHGTATPIGDAVELRALAQVLGDQGPRCGVGSIKSNLGHLFSAAGIASLLKTLLCLKHKTLVPIAGFRSAHARHHFERTRFFPVDRAQPWPTTDAAPRRAGVTSLGVGGTNCHVVLEEAPASCAPERPARSHELTLLCAPDDDALRRVAGALDQAVGSAPLPELCAAINRRSRRHSTRRALVAADEADLRAQLQRVVGKTARVRPKVMFVYSSPGSQHLGMGRHLYEDEPVFRDAFARCDALVAGALPRSLTAMLYDDPRRDSAEIDDIAVTQPLTFAFSWALHAWLTHLGLRPDGVMGHSAGEYAAACAAGVLSVEDALRLVVRRGELMALREPGAMCAVSAARDDVAPLLSRLGLSVAALNHPGQLVVSGAASAARELMRELDARGLEAKRLAIGCAAHSTLMEPARAGLDETLREVTFGAADLPLYSTLRGARAPEGALATATHWLDHLTSTVRFEQTVRAAADDGYNVFLEVGPTGGLSHSIGLTIPDRERVSAIPLVSRTVPGWEPTLRGLGALYEHGADLDAGRLDRSARRVDLPPYPYDRRRFWIADPAPALTPAPDDTLPLSATDDASLRDHVVRERAFAPGAFLMQQCLAGARAHRGSDVALRDVLIRSSLDLEAFHGDARLRFPAGGVVLESRAPGEPWRAHAEATVVEPSSAPTPVDLEALRARCPDELDRETLYAVFENDSSRMGPTVKTATAVRRGRSAVLATLESPEGVDPATRFAGLVDGAFHSLAALVVDQDAGSFVYLSFSARRVDLFVDELPARCTASVRLLGAPNLQAGAIRCDVDLLDDDGQVLLRLTEVGLRRAPADEPAPPRDLEPLPASAPHPVDAHAVVWRDAPPPADLTDGARRYIVLTQTGELPPALLSLRRRLEDEGRLVQISRLPVEPDDIAAKLALLRPKGSAVLGVDLTVQQLRAVVRALLKHERPACRELSLLGRSRANAAWLRSAAREGLGWPCRAIHVDLAAPGVNPVFLSRQLALELRARPERFAVSYEDGHRALPALEAVAPSPAPLRDDGFYWLNGGTGGIGRALIEHLGPSAKLLVTGRAEQPELSDHVLYQRADATVPEEMTAALAAGRARWGELRGVFHLAGQVRDGLVWDQPPEDLQEMMRPKSEGARVLLDVVRGAPLDFVALFSSYVTQFGRPGQSAYAAANAVLDEIAQGEHELPVVSLDWFPWSIGMADREDYQRAAWADGIIPLHPGSALDALLGVVQAGHKQLVLSAVQPEAGAKLTDEHQAVTWERPRPEARAPDLPSAQGGAQLDDIVRFLQAEIGRRSQQPPDDVDVHQAFPTMGLDSVAAVEIIRKLEDRFGLVLFATLLFEINTIAELARYLQGRMNEGG